LQIDADAITGLTALQIIKEDRRTHPAAD